MTKTMAEVLDELDAHRPDHREYEGGWWELACAGCDFAKGQRLSHLDWAPYRAHRAEVFAAALSAAGFGLVADAKAEAWDVMVANSPRLPSAVRNVVFEAVFDVVDKFNFPAQNMGYRKGVVEIGDVCGDVEKRIVAIIRARAAAVRGEG